MRLPDTPPIIVIGMHRSGTSLLARILTELGVHMGKELDVHHEAWCFKDTNVDLLAQAGAHWAKPQPFLSALETDGFFASCRELVETALARRLHRYGDGTAAPAWGWKDPRNTLTLPIWLDRFPAGKAIHLVRNGLDVALSLHRREVRQWLTRSTVERMWPPTIGACHRLWAQYVQVGRGHEARHPECLALRYEDLLANPEEELRKIAEFAAIELDEGATTRIARRCVRRPTERSRWESLRLRYLTRMGLLDLEMPAAHRPEGTRATS